MALLEVKNICKRYGGVQALSNVTFDIGAGEIVGLLGDNGAGKSTLVKIISGAVKADSGNIFFEGKPLKMGKPSYSRKIGVEMIYQDLGLCRQHTAIENIFLGYEIKKGGFWLDHKSMKSKVLELIEHLNADIPLNHAVGLMSGGQQQAVAIARSLVSDPKLIIMDEPTAALGQKETKKVLDLILSLKKKGIAVILISHNQSDIKKVTDRNIVLEQGKLKKNHR